MLQTNHFFVNLLSHRALNSSTAASTQTATDYSLALRDLDLHMQLYYANEPHAKRYVTSFERNMLYAYRDIAHNNVYKRVRVLPQLARADGNITYEVYAVMVCKREGENLNWIS